MVFLPLLFSFQQLEMWEEGDCGELIIMQSLLVQKESHVVNIGIKGWFSLMGVFLMLHAVELPMKNLV